MPDTLRTLQLVASTQRPKTTVAISAMREEELVNLICQYDTTEAQAVEAYKMLVKTDTKKYPPLWD